MATRFQRTANKSLNERHSSLLKESLQKPENKYCADCKRKDPRWASWNLGIFLCIQCSGVHRSMGTHISRVKSVDLDTWTPEQVESMLRWGNAKANSYWEHDLTSSIPPQSNLDSWIRAKYEHRKWAMKGPIPDPSTLDEHAGILPAKSPKAERQGVQKELPKEQSKGVPRAAPQRAKKDATQELFEIFMSSTSNPAPNSTAKTTADATSKPQTSNPVPMPQLRGAELFSIGKPALASSAPSSPMLDKTSLQRSTTPNPSRDDLKSSILSLYNKPNVGSAAPAQLNYTGSNAAPYGQLGSNLVGAHSTPNLLNTSGSSSGASMPQGGQYFGAFASSQQPTASADRTIPNSNTPKPSSNDALNDLIDFSDFK